MGKGGRSQRSENQFLDKVTTSHTSFWLPKDMQKKLLANKLRDQSEAVMLREEIIHREQSQQWQGMGSKFMAGKVILSYSLSAH